MVDLLSEPLTDPQFAQQVEKIEALKEKLKAIDEDFEPQFQSLEHKRRLSQLPVYNEAREVYKTIPGFWPKVFANHGIYSAITTPEEKKALKHLEDVKVDFHPTDSDLFTLTFVFGENEFFTNKEVVYEVVKDDGLDIKPFKFDWKSEDKNLINITEDPEEANSLFAFFVEDSTLELGETFLVDLFLEAPSFYNTEGGIYSGGHSHAGGCCGGSDDYSDEE